MRRGGGDSDSGFRSGNRGRRRRRRTLLFAAAAIFASIYLLGTTWAIHRRAASSSMNDAFAMLLPTDMDDFGATPLAGDRSSATHHTPFNCTAFNNTRKDVPELQHSNGGNAVGDYIERVKSSIAGKLEHCHSNNIPPSLDMNISLGCLRKTYPSLTLQYPCDAEAHMNEIRMALAPWAQHSEHIMHTAAGYSGPWIENIWIDHFEGRYDESNRTCVWDIFGPFIPIFVPWVDHWVGPKRYRYPPELIDALKNVLRPNVPYVTVSQSDDGLVGNDELRMETFPNLLVLSAGGYGHVPVPLFKQEELPNNRKPVAERSSVTSFVGSLTTDRQGIRNKMHQFLSDVDKKKKAKGGNDDDRTTNFYKYYYGGDWRGVMADSRFSLVPRGYGRTSYRLIETLQMGLVPVYIYSDVPWVPYADLGVARVSKASEIDNLLVKLGNTTVEQIAEMEERIGALRMSHFSPAGIMDQIGRFVTGNENDLRCQTLPPSPRGV